MGSSRGMISVGAVGRTDDGGLAVADFSNTSPQVCGPGVAVRSAWPGGGLYDQDGTSMAAPHVAGVAALWAEREIAATGDEHVDVRALEALLIANCVPVPGSDRRDVGRGLIRAPRDA